MLSHSMLGMDLLLLSLIVTQVLDCVSASHGILDITPKEIKNLTEGSSQILNFKFINCGNNVEALQNIRLSSSDEVLKTVDFPAIIHNVSCDNVTGVNASVTARTVGFVTLSITDEQSKEQISDYSVGVTRLPQHPLDEIYLYGLISLIIVVTLHFGLSLDLEKVLQHLKRPVAPTIGVACQFVLMPLVGFVITRIITSHNALKLGVFASAVAPGGGFSNVLAYVLGGDVDLSITMTFISSILCLGFVPLWMYTLGQYIIGDAEVTLPFANMLQALALVVVPLAIGILIKKFLPKVAKKLLYLQNLFIALITIFAVGINIWINLYAFKLVLTDYQLALSACLLPYVGGFLGFLIALACQQDRKTAITIAIETAIQNNNISIVVLKLSLEQPWQDISASIPLTMLIFVFTPFPFLLAARLIINKQRRAKEADKEEEKESQKEETHRKDMKMSKLEGVDNPAIVEEHI